MSLEGASAGAPLGYTYRPSLLGAPWEFSLAGDGIDWTNGRRSGRVAFRAIRRLRLSYRPANMQSHRFMAEIWADGAPKLSILSSSWKSMVVQERLDKPYAAFIAELHRRLAPVAPAVRFEQGSHPLLYWPGLIVFAAVSLALAWLAVRGLQADARAGAVFVGGFLALFLWQGGNFFRRNRPGLYRPDAIPTALMPEG
jgi:hypothetical protein